MSKLLEIIRSAGKPIRGTALVPVHRYPSDGASHSLRGKHCVVLGREKSGAYRGKLNFFGGRVGFGEDPLDSLYREVAEEMCVQMTPNNLDQCMLDSRLLLRRSWVGSEHFTLLVLVHITGINCKIWSDIMKERQRQRLAGCLREMTEVSHVPVDSLLTQRDVSAYVSANAEHITNATLLLNSTNAVPFQSLATVVRP